MTDDDRVIVVGGGIGGLSVAVGLQRAGIPVEIHEQHPEIKELGTGVGIQRVAQQGVEMLGLREAIDEIAGVGFEALQMVAYQSDRTMASIPRRGEAFVVHRGELLDMLKRAVAAETPVHLNSECVGFEQDSHGVTAKFADGREERCSTLIGADGVRSGMRAAIVGDGPPLYSGQTAWRGMPVYTHPTIPMDISTQVYGPEAQFGIFPCDRRLFWFASAVRPEGQKDGPKGKQGDLLDIFGGWAKGLTEIIEATPEEQIVRGDLFHRRPIDGWTRGRVVLLGDVAHPTMPAFGQGAGMAIEDAAVLARELGTVEDRGDAAALTAAFQRYEGQRIPRTSTIVNRARRMAGLCTWKSKPALMLREAVFSAVPESLWLRTYEHEHTYRL